jgi:hypothetical protein
MCGRQTGMPIPTPRLLIRPKQVGDGAITSAAVAETWDELHKWMRWAENREAFTAESMEIRNRHVMASFILRESIELIGLEAETGNLTSSDFGVPSCLATIQPKS